MMKSPMAVNFITSFSVSRKPPYLLLAALLGFLAYLPALLTFFVKDDLAVISIAQIDFPAMFTRPWLGGFFRPVAELFFALQHQLFDLHPLPYHLVSFAAHAAAAYLVYRIFYLCLNDYAKSLTVAFIFGLHPLNTESVSWISGQMSLFSGLCGFLVLMMLSSRPEKHYFLWTTLLIIGFLAGLGFYENAIVVPGIGIVIYLSSRRVHSQTPSISLAIIFILLTGISGFYLYWRFMILALRGGYLDITLSLRMGLTNLLYYLYLLNGGTAIGGRIIRYHPEDIFSPSYFLDVIPPLFIINTLLIISVGVLLVLRRIRKTDSNIHFAALLQNIILPGAWVVISLLPAFFLAERPRRIAYMTVPGYAFIICQAFFYVKQRTRFGSPFAKAGGIGYMVLLVVTLHFRNHDWRAAGDIEKQIPEIITSTACSYLAFDVPNLIGDALFFNSISTAYWLERQTGRKNLTVYAPHQIIKSGPLPDPTCYFRFTNGQVEQIQLGKSDTFPSFVKGQNWVKPE